MYVTPGEIFTGVDTNLGDLPFHLGVITGFAHGENSRRSIPSTRACV